MSLEQAVALIKAEQAAFEALYSQETENLIAGLEANITQVLQGTADALLWLDTQGDLVEADAAAHIDKLLAAAKAESAMLVAGANTAAAKADAAMIAGVQERFSASLNGEGQLLYQWIKAFEHTAATAESGARFMDLATPEALAFTNNSTGTSNSA